MPSFFEKLKKGMGNDLSQDNGLTEEIPEEEEEKEEESEEFLEEKNIEQKPAFASFVVKPADSAEENEEKKKKQKKEKTKREKRPKKEKKEIEASFEKESISEKEPEESKNFEEKYKWFRSEGQLAIDVYKTENELIIQSAIAGIKPDDLDISIEKDSIFIRGERKNPAGDGEKNYFYQECYWGPFSRQIILSEETDPGRAEATIKEGVLIIKIPIIERDKKKKIVVK